MSEETEKTETPIYHLDNDEFHRYFARAAAENEEFEIKCYRVTRKGNKTYKTWLQDFIDECPSEQELAELYGGGRFWLVAWDNKNRKLEKTVWIDELWTRKLIDSRRVEPGPPQSPQEARPDPLEQLGKVMAILKPFMNGGQPAQPQPNQMADMAVRMMEGMTESMANSLGRIQTAVIDKQLEKLDGPPAASQEPAETMSDKMGFIKEIIDLAKEFGGQLLNANGIKGKVMEQAIKSDERFAKIQEDPALYDALYTEAVNDPAIGKDKADALFQKLGFAVNQQPEGQAK